MARARTTFRCTDCGGHAPQWVGRCPSCGAWSTLVEEVVDGARPTATAPLEVPVPIAEVGSDAHGVVPVGLPELDRVLGGGLVPGSVTLLGGEPGVGKSTLLLQAAAALAAGGRRVLYLTAEESPEQVRRRAERLGALRPKLLVAATGDLPGLLGQVDHARPEVLVVDSIQTVHDPDVASAPGSVAQVRQCASALVEVARDRAMATVLVGHVTKDGSLAGPRVLEHLVDTVLSFEGDRHHALRLLRAVKHRHGSTAELGVLEMGAEGLVPVDDPSGLFLADRQPGVSGSVVVATVEGHRPLLVELQALAAPSTLPAPRRSAEGVDGGRLGMVLAVLGVRAGIAVAGLDVYALAVGGARVVEPGADLGLALAVASSATGVPVAAGTVALGEIGLGGELRQVVQAEVRLREAARLGFERAVVPATTVAPVPAGLELVRVASLVEAIEALGLDLEASGPGRSGPVR